MGGWVGRGWGEGGQRGTRIFTWYLVNLHEPSFMGTEGGRERREGRQGGAALEMWKAGHADPALLFSTIVSLTDRNGL